MDRLHVERHQFTHEGKVVYEWEQTLRQASTMISCRRATQPGWPECWPRPTHRVAAQGRGRLAAANARQPVAAGRPARPPAQAARPCSEVNIYIEVPQGVRGRDLTVLIKPKHLTLGIKGSPPYLDVRQPQAAVSAGCSRCRCNGGAAVAAWLRMKLGDSPNEWRVCHITGATADDHTNIRGAARCCPVCFALMNRAN